ncbi:MAG: hypothetical protein VBE63_30020, partial [Lamprobacter sp.]|nr:hypothetical protein [Lamprobacter sp.]
MGHALFTLCIGAAVGINYGAYAPRRLPLGRSVLAVVLFDVAAGLAFSVIVLPLLLADGLAPAQGPGLLFLGLAHGFGNSTGGDLHGALFFLLSALLALCSVVALFEPLVSTLQQRLGLTRIRASVVMFALVWSLAVLGALSLQPESAFSGLLQLSDRLLVEGLLPLGALAVAVFVGWLLPESHVRAALGRESTWFYHGWLLLLRYVAPFGVLIVWFHALAPG